MAPWEGDGQVEMAALEEVDGELERSGSESDVRAALRFPCVFHCRLTAFGRLGTVILTAFSLPSHFLTPPWHRPSHCLLTAFSLPSRRLCTVILTAFSLPSHCLWSPWHRHSHCLLTAFSLPLRRLCTVLSLPSHCPSLPLHCV